MAITYDNLNESLKELLTMMGRIEERMNHLIKSHDGEIQRVNAMLEKLNQMESRLKYIERKSDTSDGIWQKSFDTGLKVLAILVAGYIAMQLNIKLGG